MPPRILGAFARRAETPLMVKGSGMILDVASVKPSTSIAVGGAMAER